MEIKIQLSSARLQEKLDRGGSAEIAKILNDELGYGFPKDPIHGGGEVWDENGNAVGSWELVVA